MGNSSEQILIDSSLEVDFKKLIFKSNNDPVDFVMNFKNYGKKIIILNS